MSLINEALKKAQHQRTGNPADLPPMPGSSLGTHAARRGKAMPAQTLAWIVAGAAGAVVIAVLLTVLIVTRGSAPAHPSTPPPVAAKPTPPPAASAAASSASPVIVAPVITVPVAKVDLSSQKLPAADAVAAAPTVPKPEPVAAAPVTAPVPAPAPVAAAVTDPARPLTPGGQDIRILTFIDAIRVTGIRSSGTESKVLMNDRVYRVNDMVDYALGLRLTKVAADGLTFTDATGTTYVKNF